MKRKKPANHSKRSHQTPAEQVESLLSDTILGLTPKQLMAINVLAGGGTKAEAANRAGVHRNTVSYWIAHDRYFVSALQSAKMELCLASYDDIRAKGRQAIGIVLEIANDVDVDPSTRLQAAKFLVEKAVPDHLAAVPPMVEDDTIELARSAAMEGRQSADQDVMETRERLIEQFNATAVGKELIVVQLELEQLTPDILGIGDTPESNPEQQARAQRWKSLFERMRVLARWRDRVLNAVPEIRSGHHLTTPIAGHKAAQNAGSHSGRAQSSGADEEGFRRDNGDVNAALQRLNNACAKDVQPPVLKRPRPRH